MLKSKIYTDLMARRRAARAAARVDCLAELRTQPTLTQAELAVALDVSLDWLKRHLPAMEARGLPGRLPITHRGGRWSANLVFAWIDAGGNPHAMPAAAATDDAPADPEGAQRRADRAHKLAAAG